MWSCSGTVRVGAILLSLLVAGKALANDTGGKELSDTNSSGSETQADETAGTLSVSMRGMWARRQAWALWRRFGPQRRGLMSPDSPWQQAGGAGGRVSPVAAEAGGPQGWGLWLEGAPGYMRNLAAALRGRGYSLSQTLGLDRQLGEHTSVGVTFGYSYSRVRTLYNNGRERTHGIVVGPYLSHQFAPWLSLDVQAGYVRQWQELHRTDATGPLSGTRSARGYQASVAFNAWRWVNGSTMISGRLGLIATRDRWSSYVEQGVGFALLREAVTQELVQGVAEGGISWWVDPFMPYFRVSYARDVHRRNAQASSDRDDFTLTGGMTFYGSGEMDGLSLDMGGNVVVGRRKQRNWGISLGLKWSW